MEMLLGFAIALAISLTGVGAGSMTTPLLILLLGVAPATAVGSALAFGAVVKVVSLPVYAVRRQISGKALWYLLAGGVPGVLAGGFLLSRFKGAGYDHVVYMVLGSLIAVTASFHIYRMIRPKPQLAARDRGGLLGWFALPIGAEVGFSSAGAGALGSLLLFGFTRLSPAEVVGTDLCFGLVLSTLGSSIQLSAGNYDGALLLKLVIGGLFGALAGSVLAGRIAPTPLRFAVLLMLVILGIQLALHEQAAPLVVRAAVASRGH